MSGPKSAQMVLQNPTIDMAVFEVARGGIIREGLGYDRNDVAVVTNVTGDHLGLGGIDTLRQLASVKSVLVDAVPKTGTAVLNADDPLVARMARGAGGRVVYFSMATEKGTEGWDRVDTHCGRGGAAFVLQAGRRRRADRPAPRPAHDAGPLHAPHPRHVRRQGPDERGERAGGGRGRLVGRRPPPRHPAGPADVHDLVLPGARPPQPGRAGGRPPRHRLLPQRRRDAPARRLRAAHGRAGADEGRRADPPRPRRSGSSGSRRPPRRRPARLRRTSPRAPSTRSIVREDRNLRGRKPGESAENVIRGVRDARSPGRRGHLEGREDPRRDGGGPDGDPARGAGRPGRLLRRRRGGGLPARQRAARRAG